MATTETPSTPEQAREELFVRVKRTAYQVVGAFVGVSGPLALIELRTDDLITYQEGKAIIISGVTAAAALAIAIVMNYFKPVQTNP